MLPDLWTTCDLPVLTELVRRLEVEGQRQVELSLEVGVLTEQQVEAALRRLHGAGYIDGVPIAEAAHPIIVTSVHPKALQAVGAWPSPEQIVDRLLDALADAAENAHTATRSAAARVAPSTRCASLAGTCSSAPPAVRSAASPSVDPAVGAVAARGGWSTDDQGNRLSAGRLVAFRRRRVPEPVQAPGAASRRRHLPRRAAATSEGHRPSARGIRSGT